MSTDTFLPGFYLPGPWTWLSPEDSISVDEQVAWALEILAVEAETADIVARLTGLWAAASAAGARRVGVAIEPLVSHGKVLSILEFHAETGEGSVDEVIGQVYNIAYGRVPSPEDFLESAEGVLVRHDSTSDGIRRVDYWAAEPEERGYVLASFVETRLDLPLPSETFDAMASTLYWVDVEAELSPAHASDEEQK